MQRRRRRGGSCSIIAASITKAIRDLRYHAQTLCVNHAPPHGITSCRQDRAFAAILEHAVTRARDGDAKVAKERQKNAEMLRSCSQVPCDELRSLVLSSGVLRLAWRLDPLVLRAPPDARCGKRHHGIPPSAPDPGPPGGGGGGCIAPCPAAIGGGGGGAISPA